ncbi:hypothetical protein ACFLWU_05055 [Chloroflexota bacterium]
METIVIVLVSIALIVFGVMTMAQGFMTSTDSAAMSLEDITVTKGEIMRTDISLIDARKVGVGLVEVTLENTGQMKLAAFNKWDVIIEYYDTDQDYYTKWLQYTTDTPVNNEWQKVGVYLDASDNTSEVFDPGILNPGEEIVIEAKLNPPPRDGTAVNTIVATPNGIQQSLSFTY